MLHFKLFSSKPIGSGQGIKCLSLNINFSKCECLSLILMSDKTFNIGGTLATVYCWTSVTIPNIEKMKIFCSPVIGFWSFLFTKIICLRKNYFTQRFANLCQIVPKRKNYISQLFLVGRICIVWVLGDVLPAINPFVAYEYYWVCASINILKTAFIFVW